MITSKKNRLSLTYLFEVSGVSKSGYYGFSEQTDSKLLRELKDEEDFELIMQAYWFKGFNKGAKLLKMTLENQFDTIMNLKKIRRLMKKFGLYCPIRKANPYKRMAKAMKTSHVAPNKLERKFKEGKPNQILLTDITYLTYDLNQRAYLSGIKDGVTNEMHGYKVSRSLDISFVEEILETFEITRSLSRLGNPYDNAVAESTYKTFKTEFCRKRFETLEQLETELFDYVNWYNTKRIHGSLGYLSPVEYRKTLSI